MFTALRQHVLIPFHEGVIRRRHVARYRRFADNSQWWPREQLLAYQRDARQQLLRHAYEQTPYWREVLDARRLPPAGISDDAFRTLPTTTKAAIREQRFRMRAADHAGRIWTKATGGSTGEPLPIDYTAESYDWRVAMSRRGYSWSGYEEGMRQVSIWGAFSIGRESRLSTAKAELHRRMAGRVLVNSLRMDDAARRDCVDTINRHAPASIVGFTNPLYELARFIGEHGGLRVRPRSVIAAAEKPHGYQREAIEAAFGCPAFETYGNREFMLIAAECERHDGLHLSAENLYVEILDDAGHPVRPGELGEIVITDLHNYGMPFIRYRTGDMAVATDRRCACGRGLPLIEQIVGRRLDLIRTPDGSAVAGEFFPFLLKAVPGIRQFQVVQPALDRLTIRMVADADLEAPVTAAVRHEIARICGEQMQVTFERLDAIPLTPEGKLRMSISCVGQEAVPA